MTFAELRTFVRRHRVVLVSAQGPVPNVAEFVAQEPIKGSWWGHPKGHEIFRLLEKLTASPDVLLCRLIDGKQTLVHRSVWPALVRVAAHFPPARLSQVEQLHTAAGHHRTIETAFPDWVPKAVAARARALSEEQAFALLGPWGGVAPRPKSPPARQRRRS
jgi:hypothetical protein